MSIAPEPVAQLRASMLRMVTGYQLSQALYVAAKLGIADLLTTGPKTADELALECGAHGPSLYRLLRALASEGIFRETDAGMFELTPLADTLRSDVPGSMRLWAIMFNEEQSQAWSGLLTSIRTGRIAFDHVFGESFFAYLGKHPQSTEAFNRAMSGGSERMGPALAESYDFGPFDVIVDVGGGNGRLLSDLLAIFPHARGILFDQAHVVVDPATAHQLRGVADRCEVVSGNFFEDVPTGGDLYLMKRIIHDWDDARCRTILENCRRVMKTGGRLLILEAIVAPANEPDFRKWMDLHMLALLGGKERTLEEFRGLIESAGFTLGRVVPLPAEQSVIEAIPA